MLTYMQKKKRVKMLKSLPFREYLIFELNLQTDCIATQFGKR